jgi:hypothetical protein
MTSLPARKNYHSEPIHLEENRRGLRLSDVFLSSFPRSGNTWMKLLLADVILQMHGYQTDTKLPIDRHQIISDIYKHPLKEFRPAVKLPFRLIKTHERHENISGKWTWRFRSPRVIYVFRDPADALCSFYHFEKLRDSENNNAATSDEIDRFCREHVTEWRCNVESYIRAKRKKPGRVLMVSYESLHEQAVPKLRAAAMFLGIDATEEMCFRAVENHRFERQRQIEDKQFFRRGLRGGSKDELLAATIAFIEQECRSTYDRARELEAGLFTVRG